MITTGYCKIIRERKIYGYIFEYAENSVEIYPGCEDIKYVMYENGLIEKQIFDSRTEELKEKTTITKGNDEVIDTISNFYEKNKTIIESIPSDLYNPEVCDGSSYYIKFFNKEIAGINIFHQCSKNCEVYQNIKDLIKIRDSFFSVISKNKIFQEMCNDLYIK